MHLEDRLNATPNDGTFWVPGWFEEHGTDACAQPTLPTDVVSQLPVPVPMPVSVPMAAETTRDALRLRIPVKTRPLRERYLSAPPDVAPALQSASRLLALLRTTLLDTPPSEAFDRLTQMAAELLDVPTACFTLVDDSRQFTKSQYDALGGTGDPNKPLSHSFCKFVVATGAPLVVSDAATHPWVRDNPSVREMNIGAYFGVPVQSMEGETVGAFCVVDHKPRVWTERDGQILQHIAHTVMTYMNLRTTLRETRWIQREAEQNQTASRAILEATTSGMVGIDAEGRCTYLNHTAAHLLGVDAEQVVGQQFGEFLAELEGVAEDESVLGGALLDALDQGQQVLDVDGELATSSGRRVAIVYSIIPVILGDAVKGAVLTFRDVTDRQRTRKLLALEAALGRARAEAITAHVALGRMMQVLGESCTAKWCALWVPDQFSGVLRCLYTWVSPDLADTQLQRLAMQTKVEYGRTSLGTAWRSGKTERHDPRAEAMFSDPWRVACRREGLVSGTAVPLRGEIGVVGVLEVLWASDAERPDYHEQSYDVVRAYLTTALERRTIELAKHGRAAMTSTVFEHAPFGMLLVDANGAVLDANPLAEHLLNLPLVALVGITLDQLLPEASHEELHRALAAHDAHTASTPLLQQTPLSFTHPDGHTIQLNVTALPMAAGPVGCLLALQAIS